MEYLVTMTTQIPAGASDEAIQDIRSREAYRSLELAAQGLLLRLWRPPHQPGEWRTLGLFAANDAGHLEGVLQSMPLRVWRRDEVTLLSPHPNDPAHHTQTPKSFSSRADGVEFLTTFTTAVPTGTPDNVVTAATTDEADRAGMLAEQGNLLRLWTLPGQGQTLGLWWATDMGELNTILASLPLSEWMTVETTPLSPHPNDPALGAREHSNIR